MKMKNKADTKPVELKTPTSGGDVVMKARDDLHVFFSHVQLYVDHVGEVEVYKDLETKMNTFTETISAAIDKKNGERNFVSIDAKRDVWNSIQLLDPNNCTSNSKNENTSVRHPTKTSHNDTETCSVTATGYIPQGRDIIKQLILGFGFRVTGCYFPSNDSTTNTKSILITSEDSDGVQFIISAAENTSESIDGITYKENYQHFDAKNIHRFLKIHSNRQGVAVLGFAVNQIETIHERYKTLHPKLIHDFSLYTNEQDCTITKILEVYAYYHGDEKVQIQEQPAQNLQQPKERLGNCNSQGEQTHKEADRGTILRFIERRNSLTGVWTEKSTDKECCSLLPGLSRVDAKFDGTSQAAYCDHWVSNVFSRTGFLSTLEDTLGFTPKVDFNAGVVAAGEAQIESTVTGNNSSLSTDDKNVALRDHSQVYLPINNALSEVGHVSGFLNEIGQGIQHVACRVQDLVEFVQHGNDNRRITGEGFSFLKIPRSYYGTLSAKQLVTDVGLSIESAIYIMSICEEGKVISSDGAVDLNLSREDIEKRLVKSMTGSGEQIEIYQRKREQILDTILKSRYTNLHSLLKDHVSEDTYMGIVSNQILVDVQGEDLLYQIFTSNILQRNPGEEAPFLEFIQRVCSEKNSDPNGSPIKIKPGCGGFGIRNFLTLFLSIEVSKAMVEVSDARLAGDERRRVFAQKRVDCFTSQLNESNPILTEISDAMTLEGVYKRELESAQLRQDTDKVIESWKVKLEIAYERKTSANDKLMECSAKYEKMMKCIRESGI